MGVQGAMTRRLLPAFVVAAASLLSSSSALFTLPSPYGWSCANETCIKQEHGITPLMSLSTCKLTCGEAGVLWPRPTGVTHIGDQTVNFDISKLKLKKMMMAPTQEVKDLVDKAFDIFKNNVAFNLPNPDSKETSMKFDFQEIMQRDILVEIEISKSGTATRLALETNEAYAMNINTDEHRHTNITILSSTFFGARHALETLSQLIGYDEAKGALEIVSSAAVSDSPKFKYRGILLDTARNFFSVKAIERILDAMAANKLNTFHWHITDAASFPLYLESLPEMVYYGAYSTRQVYKTTDIYHLVEYGRVRGIRVLPEFDTPGHVGNGWQWTEKKGLGQLAVCVNQEPWTSYCNEPPCGQLNIVNQNTYTVLGKIYKEMADIFGPLDLFHFGGDEQVNLNCWNNTEEIVTYMSNQGMDRSADSFLQLWGDFQAVAYGLLTAGNNGRQIPGVLWTSQLTGIGQVNKYLDPEQYIIQIGTSGKDEVVRELLQKGFHVIFSNHDAWNLGCGYGSWVNKDKDLCGNYKGWQAVYDNSPSQIALNLTGSVHSNLILGGEATLWSQQVDETSMDAKLWPRGAALGERLWTNPDHNWEPAEIRFIHQRQRMVQRGIQADRIQPQWCHQNEGLCYLK